MLSSVSVALGVLRVFLDCSSTFCHEEYLREEVELAAYVRDRTDADVHVLITRADTSAGGGEYTLAFIGQGAFQATTRTLRVVTEPNQSDDRVRRQLASALTVGLLTYLAADAVPQELEVSAALESATATVVSDDDPWKRWIFGVDGNMFIESEESTFDRNWGLSFSADRVTPEWKLALGTNFNESQNRFNLDEEGEEEIAVTRRRWSIDWLGAKSLSEHWSAGVKAEARSSTFENLASLLALSPVIEWNFFPYSMYTRRQLRVEYGVGPSRRRYYEETLFGRLRESRWGQQLSAAYEQREPWGTLEGRAEASNYFPGLDRHRVEIDTEVDVRVARGLSLSVEASASRIRDQLSLPRRNASAEEVLLRLRELRSGFEARFEFGIEYQFGSRFAAIVNPRFGQ